MDWFKKFSVSWAVSWFISGISFTLASLSSSSSEIIPQTLLPADKKLGSIVESLLGFAAQSIEQEMRVPIQLGGAERAQVHKYAQLIGLGSVTEYAEDNVPYVKVYKLVKRDAKKKRRKEKEKSVVGGDSSSPKGKEKERQRNNSFKGKDRGPGDLGLTSKRELFIYDEIYRFIGDKKKQELVIQRCDSDDRKTVHEIAEYFGNLQHSSLGNGRVKHMVLRKLNSHEVSKKKRTSEAFQKALQSYRKVVKTQKSKEDLEKKIQQHYSSTEEEYEDEEEYNEKSQIDHQPAPAIYSKVENVANFWDNSFSFRNAGLMRYADWNIEWMNHWFADDFTFYDYTPDISDVSDLCYRVAQVIMEMDPDILAVQEGPSSIEKMNLFCSTYLNDAYQVFGGLESYSPASSNSSTGNNSASLNLQQLYFLVKKDGKIRNPRLFTEVDNLLKAPWQFDISGEFIIEEYQFTRRPLVIRGDVLIEGRSTPMVFCNMHAKSKYVNKGERLWQSSSEEERLKYIKTSVKNRRRIAAECLRLRKVLDQIVFSSSEFNQDPFLIVSGDFNDGPGMDFFEENYLLGDCVYSLLGSTFNNRTKLLYSILDRDKYVPRDEQWSVIFDDYVDEEQDKRALLDHIFVSDAILDRVYRASIAHVIFNKYSTFASKSDRQTRPSDHRPVFVDLRT
jgi:endonuclease/exonuclease/phosphatase family metal-dependent hydrolase